MVDDNRTFLEQAAALLATVPGIDVVARFGSAEEALPLVAALQVDLVLLDLAMPGIDGLEATRRIKGRDGAPRVIIASFHDTEQHRAAAARVGADAFVAKTELVEELIPLLQRAVKGGTR